MNWGARRSRPSSSYEGRRFVPAGMSQGCARDRPRSRNSPLNSARAARDPPAPPWKPPAPTSSSPYRGALRAAIAEGHVLAFVTVHPEGQPTALYRLDVDKGELATTALPAGGTAVVADETALYVAGTDGHIHKVAAEDGQARAARAQARPRAGRAGPARRRGASPCSQARGGDPRSRERRAPGSACPCPRRAARSPPTPRASGSCAGTVRGTVVVFDAEDKARLPRGRVEEAARGRGLGAALRPRRAARLLDRIGRQAPAHPRPRRARARGSHAAGAATRGCPPAIVARPGGQALHGREDGAIKTWARGAQKRRPSTQKDGATSAAGLSRVEHKGRPHLALLGDDATHPPVPARRGRQGRRADAHLPRRVRARGERARAAGALAPQGGAGGARRVRRRARHRHARVAGGVRRAITPCGCRRPRSSGRRATRALGSRSKSCSARAEEQVRLAALGGLRALEGAASLRPLELALSKKKRDLGTAAVTALAELATSKATSRATSRPWPAWSARSTTIPSRCAPPRSPRWRRSTTRARGRRRPPRRPASPRCAPSGPTCGAWRWCASSSASSSASPRCRPRCAATRATPTPTCAAPRSWSR